VKERYRVGIVGASFGALVHAPAFAAQGRFDVVAIASPNRASEVARRRNIAHAFPSVEAMLAATDLDVVSIAAPPFEHYRAVLAALERGMHVLCEKPFALDVGEAQTMLAAAERAGTVCALAHEFRYVPARLALRELVENGHLGPLRAIEVTTALSFLRADGGRPNSWWFQRVRGGGISGAILSHGVDLASWLAGRPPHRTAGYERTANPLRHVDGETFASDVADGAFATIDYGEGLVATVWADGTRAAPGSTTAVHGERRTAVTSGPNMLDLRTFVVDDEETAELEIAAAPHGHLAAAHPNLPPFVALLDDFVAALDGNPSTIPTFADGLETQRVLAAIGYGR